MLALALISTATLVLSQEHLGTTAWGDGEPEIDLQPQSGSGNDPNNEQCRLWTCPLNTVGCFKILELKDEAGERGYTWTEAEKHCRVNGLHLPIIHDRAENLALESSACFHKATWLGLRRDSHNFRWQPSGAMPLYSNYKCSRGQSDGDCVMFNPQDKPWPWLKANCSDRTRVYQVVCQNGAPSQCDPHWTPYAGYCYYLNKEQMYYAAAKAYCTSQNAFVVDIQSADEQSFLVGSLQMSQLGHNVWIGYTDVAKEGTFVWERTGQTGAYTNWRAGEPNNYGGGDCSEMVSSGKWNDYPCSGIEPRFTVCKKAAVTRNTVQLMTRLEVDSSISGFVSFKSSERRGALCLRSWSNNAASVVCRQHLQGFGYGRHGRRRAHDYPHQTGFWIGHEFCKGQESHLAECVDVKWIDSSLKDRCPYQVASTECYKGNTTLCYYDSLSEPRPVKVGENAKAKVGETVVFNNCSRGKRFVGPRSVECLPNGEWDKLFPECEVVQCTNPGVPQNAERNGTGFSYGEEVQFRCYYGYKMVGLDTNRNGWSMPLVCTENGTWSDILPLCIKEEEMAVTCERPAQIDQNLRVKQIPEQAAFQVGSSITFSCSDGYVLNGSATARCLPTRNWSHIPWCEKKVDCIQPPQGDMPPHVVVKQDVSGRLRYACAANYLVDLTAVGLDKGFPVCDSNGKRLRPPTCVYCPTTEWHFAHRGSCYHISNVSAQWETALSACHKLSNTSGLVSIDTPEEADVLSVVTQRHFQLAGTNVTFWTALQVNNSVSSLPNQLSLAYEAWSCEQPAEVQSNSLCVYATSGNAKSWKSSQCSAVRWIICEKRAVNIHASTLGESAIKSLSIDSFPVFPTYMPKSRKRYTLCADDFGMEEAAVVCRQHGYSTASNIITIAFGNNTRMSFRGLSCRGTEDDIHQCPYQLNYGRCVSGHAVIHCCREDHCHLKNTSFNNNRCLLNGMEHRLMGGYVVGLSDQPGAVVEFRCRDGYHLNGTSVMCSVDSKRGRWDWNTTWPRCIRPSDDCNTLALEKDFKIPNGFVQAYRNQRSCWLVFGCNAGFTLVGESVLTKVFIQNSSQGYLSSGWSGKIPTCQATCRPEETVHKFGTLLWPATSAPAISSLDCPHVTSMFRQYATRSCSLTPTGAEWQQPNASRCILPATTEPSMTELTVTNPATTTEGLHLTSLTAAMTETLPPTTQPVITGHVSDVERVLEDLVKNKEMDASTVTTVTGRIRKVLTEKLKDTTPQAVSMAADLIEKATAVKADKLTVNETQKVTENIVNIISQIALANASTLRNSQARNRSTTRLVKSLEKFADALSKHPKTKKVHAVAPRLALHVEKFCGSFKGAAYVSQLFGEKPFENENLRSDQVKSMPPGKDYGKTEAAITVPMSVTAEAIGDCNKPVRMKFTVYQDAQLFGAEENNGGGEEKKINSRVIAASVDGAPLSGDVELSFRSLKPLPGYTPSCQFWDFSAKGGLGDWSSKGCLLVESPTGGIGEHKCRCDHLTNFALLMSLRSDQKLDEDHTLALNVLTWIGCVLSIVCLVITVVILLSFKRLRDVEHSQAVVALCLTLSIALALFLTIDQVSTKDTVACQTVSAFLHFFLLASFGWMLAEGVAIYFLLVRVMSRFKHFFLKAAVGAFGIPAVIVSLSVIVDRSQYSRSKVCFLDTPLFYYTFYAPVALVILLNLLIFVRAVVVLASHARYHKRRAVGKNQRQFSRELSWTVGLTFLLGLTWLVGFFMIDHDQVWVQYVFVVMATSQGAGIFIFQCFVRRAVRRCLAEAITSRGATFRQRSNSGKSRSSSVSVSRSSSTHSKHGFQTSEASVQNSALNSGSDVAMSSNTDSLSLSIGQSPCLRSSFIDHSKKEARDSQQLHVRFEEAAVGKEPVSINEGETGNEELHRAVALTVQYTAVCKRLHEAVNVDGITDRHLRSVSV